MEVKATRIVGEPSGLDPFKVAGAFLWRFDEHGQPVRMTFACPCGCGAIAAVEVQPANPHGWEFNGNLDVPTVRPSIRIGKDVDPDHWHGYLTDGVFRSC